MRKNIICIDLTKFNNEKLVDVAKELSLDYNSLLSDKKEGFAKLYIGIKGTIAFTMKGGKDKIHYTKEFTNDLSNMDSFELVKEPIVMNVDSILEKISKFGISSITTEEKEFFDNNF